jgi:hypothetical protein
MTQAALLGTWQLTSYLVFGERGEQSMPYGEHPTGYLTYSADGRMQVIGTASGRKLPPHADLTVEEHAVLYQSMFAYAGTYSVAGGEVTHHVDISWNAVWTGTDQVRHFELTGNTLTISSRLTDPVTGKENEYVLVWEKLIGPR